MYEGAGALSEERVDVLVENDGANGSGESESLFVESGYSCLNVLPSNCCRRVSVVFFVAVFPYGEGEVPEMCEQLACPF